MQFLRYLFVVFMLLLLNNYLLYALEEDSLVDINTNTLRLKLEEESTRKIALLAQTRKEREMLVVVQDATIILVGHYRSIRMLKEKNLTASVLDRNTVNAIAYAAYHIKNAQQITLEASTAQEVKNALDSTAYAMVKLKKVYAINKNKEQQILATAPNVPVEKIRVLAIETMQDLKKGLAKNIKAQTSTQKMIINNMSTLKENLLDIETGIRAIEKAVTVERVGEILIEVGFDKQQLRLIDQELGLKGRRGREIVTAISHTSPLVVKQKTLLLMQTMQENVHARITAKYSGNKKEIHNLTRLEAKLKRVAYGIDQVEKATTGLLLGKMLVEIQLDLGTIDKLRIGSNRKYTTVRSSKKKMVKGVQRGSTIPKRLTDKRNTTDLPGFVVDEKLYLLGELSIEEKRIRADKMFVLMKNQQRMSQLSLFILGALLCSFIFSVKNLYLRH